MIHYATSTDAGYLSRFMALYESMEEHCQPFMLHVLALDRAALDASAALPHARATPLADIENERLLEAKANRKRVEYIWTTKPTFMRRVLAEKQADALTWLGADCMFFGDPEPAFAEIGEAPCALAPHRFSPQCAPRDDIKTHPGLYNGDYCYVRNDERGRAFIAWWADACIKWCYLRNEYKFGRHLYVDQKWLDDAPEKWGAHVLRHKGAHLAPWNQGQYSYSWRGGSIYVDDQPLLWYHFHKGLTHGFKFVHPFVEEHVYGPYRETLEW